MAIVVFCECGRQIKAKNELSGKKVKCPSCGKPVEIKEADTSSGQGLQEIEFIPGGKSEAGGELQIFKISLFGSLILRTDSETFIDELVEEEDSHEGAEVKRTPSDLMARIIYFALLSQCRITDSEKQLVVKFTHSIADDPLKRRVIRFRKTNLEAEKIANNAWSEFQYQLKKLLRDVRGMASFNPNHPYCWCCSNEQRAFKYYVNWFGEVGEGLICRKCRENVTDQIERLEKAKEMDPRSRRINEYLAKTVGAIDENPPQELSSSTETAETDNNSNSGCLILIGLITIGASTAAFAGAAIR